MLTKYTNTGEIGKKSNAFWKIVNGENNYFIPSAHGKFSHFTEEIPPFPRFSWHQISAGDYLTLKIINR